VSGRNRLPISENIKLARNNFYSTIGIRNASSISIEQLSGLAKIKACDGEIWTTSIKRWRRYRHGIAWKRERLLKRYCYDELNPSSGIAIDVGANVGETAIALASRGHHVYAIEPEPLTLTCLLNNTKNETTITVVDGLLWSKEEYIDFHIDQEDADSSIIMHNEGVLSVRRKATTLDRFCEEHSLDRIAFLKADCEGAEPELLEGARIILKQVECISLDTGAERLGKTTSRECELLLKDAGFFTKTVNDEITLGWRHED